MGYVRGYVAISKAMKDVLSRLPAVDKNVYKTHDYLIHVTGNSAFVIFE